MLVYNGYTWTADVKVGDKVKVTGTSTVYGLAKQFGQGSTYEVIETVTVDHGQAKELTAADCDAYLTLKTITPEYVKLTGTLSVSNGKYFNIAIEGATIVGSATYPIDVEAVTALDGKEVEVIGYATGVTGNSTKYLNILFTEIKEVESGEVTPTDKEYTVKFVDKDGNELVSLKVKEGQAAIAPDAPVVEGYEFKGWDTDFSKVVSDLVIKPIYEEKQEVIIEEKTIAEIIAAENGEYATTGVVVGVNAQSFLIKDETGIMLVYNGYTWTADVKVGDKVKVTGTSTVYGLAKQFGQGSTYEVIETVTVDHGQAKELTAADCDVYAGLEIITPEYVKLTGTLSVSSGKYFNIAIEGATIVGSATYPIDVEAVTALDGKEVEVVGYVTGVTGNTTKYLNILFTEIKEVESGEVNPDPDPEPVIEEKTIVEIIAAENGEYTTTGVVVGVNARSFLIQDETGTMLVYNGGSWTADVKVGDKVKVTGISTVYGKAKQFGEGSTYEVVETVAVDYGQVKELTAADCDAYAGLEIIAPEYVKVTGTLAVSGYYYNVTIEGATMIGSITYPSNADELKALDGKEIEITGYVTGATSKYLNFLALEVNAVDGGEVTPDPDPEPVIEEKTIAEIIAAENGEYATTGVVVGVNAQSFLIKDETGIMLVYNGYTWTADVKVGDKVKVTGTSTVYGLAKQFGQGSTYEVIESVTVDHGQAKELTAADCDVYAGLEIIAPEYVKVSGVLAVSGNYYNVTIEGATVVGSITYPINADEVKALAGKTIEIVGYVTGFSGGKYLNFLALEVNVIDSGEVTPEPNPEPTGESATISFADVANRTSFSTECQVWEQNGIKVTNNKGASTSNVADYSNPVRFYKSSNLLIETTNNMSKIVITFNSAKDPLVASDAFVGCTYTLEGMIGTIVFNEPSNSFKYDNLPYQIRIEKIEVYFTE